MLYGSVHTSNNIQLMVISLSVINGDMQHHFLPEIGELILTVINMINLFTSDKRIKTPILCVIDIGKPIDQ